jgi:hypothetical protein
MVANSGSFTPGHPKRGGRKKGGRNKVAADVRELAQVHTTDAIDTLAGIIHDAEAPHAARIMAANALLDRGHGRPVQAISGSDGGALVDVNLTVVRDAIAGKLDRIFATRDAKQIEASGPELARMLLRASARAEASDANGTSGGGVGDAQ